MTVAVLGLGLGLGLGEGRASGEPCRDPLLDPVATPVRDAALDAQRGACPRDELSSQVTASALLDTPGFHGVLGGDVTVAGRHAIGALELGVRARLVDATFVQTAVNKVTDAALGPIAVSAAYAGRLGDDAVVAVIAEAELPYTRDDRATMRTGGQLAAAVTAALSPRWQLHGRLGAVAAVASSLGGTAHQLGLRAGIDVAWRARRRLAIMAGAESQAGWNGGFDAIVARAGLQLRVARCWRGQLAIGAPLGGNERTTAVLGLGIARDL